jgi:hypothetical protein
MSSLAVATILAQAELDGVTVVLLDDDSLTIKGTDEAGYGRWSPVISDLANEIVLHLRENRANPFADVLRAAESIIRSPGGCC